MNAEFETAGERLCQRSLEQEMRVGIPHYKVGQHRAVIVGEDVVLTAALSYVNPLGEAVVIPCRKTSLDGDWEPMGLIRRAGPMIAWGVEKLLPEFEFTDKMIAALREAEERHDG